KSIDMKKDIHPYTEVVAIQKRLLVALAIGLYLAQVFVPTCRADHNWKVSFKTKGNIRYSSVWCAEINGNIGILQIFWADVFSIVFVYDQGYFMTSFESKFFNELPHFAVSE